ncbi:hypothetical protein RUM43_010933 [Polyplax serrata]|uniref:Inosine/uridine-preferring nucleoside hydrolase domain-containing protein n=1 Tax=Polyplax serrata TaxID=468196 RepID=A0AAN8PU07_POLSC
MGDRFLTKEIVDTDNHQYAITTVDSYLTHDKKKLLIVDTDAGSDDGVAILNLLGAEKNSRNIKTVLITTVQGNTHVDIVGRNVLKVLKTSNRLNIPVFRGLNESLLYTPETDYFYGSDAFGDFYFPDPPSEDLIKTKHAVNALIESVAAYPGKLSLVCLGPLTNIAMAAKMDDTFLRNLREIFVLGGSDSGIGNIKPGREFNFYMDPEAAYVVLNGVERVKKRLNLVTWETASKRTTVSMDWRKNVLGALNSSAVELINKAEKPQLVGDTWISADTILTSIVIDDKLIEKSSDYHAIVEPFGEYSKGALFIDYQSDRNQTKNIRLIEKIDTETYKNMLLQNLKH